MDPWATIGQLSREESRALQNKKLYSFINTYLYPFSPYYQRLLDQNHINPKNIRSIEDLAQIPLTSKKDLLDPPPLTPPTGGGEVGKFKDFILQPDEAKIKKSWPLNKLLSLAIKKTFRGAEYVKDQLENEFRPVFMTFTTGTTNQPMPFLFTNYDIQNLYVSGSRMLNLFAIKNTEPIVNIFPYAPHLAFWQVAWGGLACHALILSTGGGKTIGTEGNIKAILKMKPSVILGVPSYVYHVIRTAHEKKCKMDFVKKIVVGAAKIPLAFKKKIAELLEDMGAKDISVFGTYGFTEARCAWAECPTSLDVSSGYHLYPDKEIIEIIDPKTGEVKKEGEDGEIVYTSLDARGSAVLRYRTGDFVHGGITYEPCPHCGRRGPRLSSDITRLSDVKDLKLSKIKGTLVDLNVLASCLSEMESIDEWQIEIRKRNNDPFDVDECVVYVCPRNGSNDQKLSDEIKKRMASSTEVTPNEVKFISLDEMVKRLELETANKEKRIVDNRPKE